MIQRVVKFDFGPVGDVLIAARSTVTGTYALFSLDEIFENCEFVGCYEAEKVGESDE